MKRIFYFIILVVLGLLVYLFGGYWADLSYTARSLIKVVIPLLFFTSTILCGRIEYLKRWRAISVSFLAASCGFLISWFLADPLMDFLGASADSVQGIGLAKLIDSILIVIPVIIVARLGGMTPSALYLSKGNLRMGLIIGVLAFLTFFILFILQSLGENIPTNILLEYLPWTLVFIFANAFMEELHFRGLLLNPFEQLLGRPLSNLCISVIFTVVHAPVKYTPDIMIFLGAVFLLSLAWGYITQRTRALWGSVLFHAGSDLLVVVGIYSTYGAT